MKGWTNEKSFISKNLCEMFELKFTFMISTYDGKIIYIIILMLKISNKIKVYWIVRRLIKIW